MKLKNILLTAITAMLTISMYAQTPGEPPVKAPYPENLDKAATNKWWETAKAAREGKIGSSRHPKGSTTVTGRHFLDLKVPRQDVIAFALYTIHNKTLKKPRTAVANPWDAWTLEWSTPSPPELKNFDEIPQVHSRRPLWDLNNPDNPDKKLN